MNIAIYARVSSEAQAKEGTIDSQIAALRDYAKAHELTISREFIDNGYSGADLNRPGLDQLRDAISESQFEAILVLSPDRLSRKQAHQIILLEEFKKRNIQILFTNHRSGDTPEDNLMLQIQGAVSEYERAKIFDRTRRGRKHAVDKGQVIGPNAPYGYRFVLKSNTALAHWEVDPQETALVRLIFDLYVKKGFKPPTIAKYLEDQGIASRSSYGKWWDSSIYAILKNEAYTGTAYMFKTQSAEPSKGPKIAKYRRRKNSSHANRPRADWIGIPVTPIIDLKVWERAQQLLKQNAVRASRNNTKNDYLLRGLVICGLCGSIASGHVSHKHTYYSCGARRNNNITTKPHDDNIAVSHPAFDREVWNRLVHLLDDPTNLKAQLAKKLESRSIPAKVANPAQATADQDLQRLTLQAQRVIDAYREGIITLADLKDQKAKLAAKRKLLEAAKKATPGKQESAGRPEITMAMLGDVSARYRRVMGKADFATKQKLVNLLVNSVTLYPDKAVVEGNIPVTPADALAPTHHGVPPRNHGRPRGSEDTNEQ